MELSSVSSQEGTITLYFLLPKNCKAEECSKLFKYAYQACREHGLGPLWLTSEECLQMIPTKKDVFVCDPFKGKAFDFLLSGAFKCVRVLGPRCLLTCLHSKKPIPELPSPLHNMAMYEIVVTSTGFEKEEKVHLQEMVQKMCGIYSNSFHEGITHLVAKSVLSKKYMVAVEKETPVMTEEWVEAVWNASNRESDDHVSATEEQFIKFTCAVFRGLTICVSQLPRNEKDILKSVIEKNGGIYAANMEMSATSLLITSSAEGEKYKHAVRWRIPCISQDWVQDSIENGFALPWDNYIIKNKPKASTPTNDQTVRGPPDLSICSTIMNESLMNCTTKAINETNEQDASLFLKRTFDHRISIGISALEDLDLKAVMKAGQFLDGCKIFLTSSDSALNEKLRKILNVGGATRFNNLNNAVTHILVVSVKHVDAHLNTIKSWNVKPYVVTADWLVECVKQGKLVEEDKFLYLNNEIVTPKSSSTLQLKNLAKPTPKSLLMRPEGNDETLEDEELMNQYLVNQNSDKKNISETLCEISSLPGSQTCSGEGEIFKDLIFTVSGYITKAEEEMKELICENGGEIADLNTSRIVNYSVVSPEGEGIFHPNALNYVTHNYLSDCIENETLLAVEYFHMPFVWPSNSSVLDSCVITMTMYTGKERRFLIHVANQLGALYQDMFSRKDNFKKGVKCSTHLICPLPEGNKFSVSKTWGVPAITKDWLLTCANEGYKVPEIPYMVDENPKIVDCKNVMISLIKKADKLDDGYMLNEGDNSLIAPTPLNKKVRSLIKQHSYEIPAIQTPDAETIRKMYPTPGARTNDSLDAMPTPETPYGTTWYANPPPRIRKGLKRALDALPDDSSNAKRPVISPNTPDEVYIKKYTEKLKNFVANYPLPKPPSFSDNLPSSAVVNEEQKIEHKEKHDTTPAKPADYHGPLTGVVAYTSRKLIDSQRELYSIVSELGGDYRWTYDSLVTHFLHYGRMNDTNKEFRVARDQGKFIVAPDWIYMCRDEGKRIDESLFPHVHNPKMSLSIISTKSTPARVRKSGRRMNQINLMESQLDKQNEDDNEEDVEGEEEECEEESEKEERLQSSISFKNEALAKQLEELENLALVTGGVRKTPTNNARSKSLTGEKILNTPTRPPSTQHKTGGNTETESQNTAITWDDPQEREARAKLEVALVGDTEDILSEKKQENGNGNDPENINSPSKNVTSEPSLSFNSANYVFAISGMGNEDKEFYIDIVYNLGGTVIDSKNFDSSITHVVTTKPARSEKYLASVATGKWIVYKSYLDCSKSAGHFVDETEYEWGNPKAVTLPNLHAGSTEDKLASAAHRWRLKHRETGKGAYYNIKAIFYSGKDRVANFTRLVEAGGGNVVHNCEDDVTHCFVELNKSPKVDLALYAAREIPCLSPMYLNELLLSEPPPDEIESCIQEYKEILANMKGDVRNISRSRHR